MIRHHRRVGHAGFLGLLGALDESHTAMLFDGSQTSGSVPIAAAEDNSNHTLTVDLSRRDEQRVGTTPASSWRSTMW